MTYPMGQDPWRSGENYDRYMGRWSREVAPRFLGWLAPPRGLDWLDVGCGTGALAAALAERAHARVWGVDPSREMLAAARRAVPRGVGLRRGRGEELPFRDGWFDAVAYSLSLHLLERPRALAEAARVLVPGGRVAVATFAPEHFDVHWLRPWFPRMAEVDRARFPTPDELERELAEAGFGSPRARRLSWRGALPREEALARIAGRHISTFDLLDPEEVRAGAERAARELPETVEQRLEALVVAADRP